MNILPFLLVLGAPATAPGPAASALQTELQDFDIGPGWIYDDLEKGLAQARRDNKPLLVTFRCVPCEACKTFDVRVRKNDPALKNLFDSYVKVRIIQMRGLDLQKYQWDFDQSWSALILSGDGTILARYGTHGPNDPMSHNSMDSFRKTLERALALFKSYPGNNAELRGKQARPFPFDRPELIPALKDKAVSPTTKQTCIHCHMIHDGIQKDEQARGVFSKESFQKRYPLAENLGLIMDQRDGLRVLKVDPGSAAGKAGIQKGDLLARLDGQALCSQADIQWALHHVPDDIGLRLGFKRGSRDLEVTLPLSGNWKVRDQSWRASLYSLHPRENFWAPELDPAGRKKAHIPTGKLALGVKWIPDESTARPAGLKEGDIILAIDGSREYKTPRDLAYYTRFTKEVGDILSLTVLREGKEIVLSQKLN